MRIYVVYDSLYEEVISVHKTEEGARKRCEEKNDEREKEKGQPCTAYCIGYDDFELED